MRKILTPGSWEFYDQQCRILPVRTGKVPLGSNDKRILAKIADEGLLSKIASLHKQPGEELIHMLAVGSTERFGPNRNGDGFREAICQRYHPSFVKCAMFYRNHQSQNPRISYGVVKLSHFNPRMSRIELVAALNADAEAARRNGGLVADIEMNKLASGQDIPVSMGCRVSHDVCSYCGNHAATRAEYCDEGMCKAGGLKRNMGRLLASGDVLHADNPDPNFNDISHIVAGRQADRIAYVTGVLQKQASDSGRIVSGAELAELYGPEQAANRWSDLAADVAYWEDRANQKIAATLPYEELRLPEFPLVKLSQMTAALADRSVILSAAEFAKVLAAGNPVPEVQIKQAAQGVFSRLACPDDNPYEHRGPIDSRYLKWAADVEATHSLKEEVLWKRAAFRSALDVPQQLLPNTKQAGTAKLAEELAQQYGLYVLASIDRMRARNRNLQLTATAAILQNRIC